MCKLFKRVKSKWLGLPFKPNQIAYILEQRCVLYNNDDETWDKLPCKVINTYVDKIKGRHYIVRCFDTHKSPWVVSEDNIFANAAVARMVRSKRNNFEDESMFKPGQTVYVIEKICNRTTMQDTAWDVFPGEVMSINIDDWFDTRYYVIKDIIYPEIPWIVASENQLCADKDIAKTMCDILNGYASPLSLIRSK